MSKSLLATVVAIPLMTISGFALAQDPQPEQSPPAAVEPAQPPASEPSAPPAAQPGPSTEQLQQSMPEKQAAETPSPGAAPTLSEEEANQWVGKAVYSSDDKEIGTVAEIKRDGDNNIIELRADIGGFLGFGETRVSLTPDRFQLQRDDLKVVLNLNEEEASNLPAVEEEKAPAGN